MVAADSVVARVTGTERADSIFRSVYLEAICEQKVPATAERNIASQLRKFCFMKKDLLEGYTDPVWTAMLVGVAKLAQSVRQLHDA